MTRIAELDRQASPVHLNLLTAEFLVDGRPLARHPKEYKEHSVNVTLFGKQPLKLCPLRCRGCRFPPKRPIKDGMLIEFRVAFQNELV
jgi:hypothetical protein